MAKMQTQRDTGTNIKIGTQIVISAVLAVDCAEQVSQRMRIFEVSWTVTKLTVQFESIGIFANKTVVVTGIVVIQTADVIRENRSMRWRSAGFNESGDIAAGDVELEDMRMPAMDSE